MKSVLIRGGTVYDGTGAPGFKGHVLVRAGRIEAVLREPQPPPQADEVLDAVGCAVAPGFIDMHSHSDWVLPLEDHPLWMKPFLEQGVTTVIAGNCGVSTAPMGRRSPKEIEGTLAATILVKPLESAWPSMSEYLQSLERSRPAVNIAELVGHGTIRFACSRTRRGMLSPDDLGRCLDELRRSLDDGAFGLSFGLGYDPGMFSPLEEIEAFCKVAVQRARPVTVHLKALSRFSPTYPLTTFKPHNLVALQEMLAVARKTGVRLQISHFLFVGRRSWPTAERALRMVENAARNGVDVRIDAFPYTCGNTTINALLPHWFLASIPGAYRSRWALARLKAEFEIGFRFVGFSYPDLQIMHAAVPGMEPLDGLRITEVAELWKVSPFEALLRLSRASRGATSMLFHTYSGEPGNEKVLEAVLKHPLCLFETDALVKASGYPNPAALGTFPRILGPLGRDKGLFSVESAIHRMTGASAERFGLSDRGILAKGKAADIVVFDPDSVSDSPPSGSRPAGRPRGIKEVLLNGVRVVRVGSYVPGARAGEVLRR